MNSFAVLNSWESPRSVKYREAESITGLLDTAVNMQAMCFGNMGSTSGTGVCFTHNPNIGESKLYGEYLVNAQGEDGELYDVISAVSVVCSFCLKPIIYTLSCRRDP
jgi:phosphoenolpyruvate synthase/pyruvate phosphate dikinase